jgi:hypothetical protein
MFFTNDNIDIEQYELDKIRPASLVRRGERELWIVREQPVETELSPRYLWVLEGTHVKVPLFPHLVSGVEPAIAMAASSKFGVIVISDLYEWLGPPATRIEIVRTHITVGHPVQDMSNGFRFWVGFAFQVRERLNHDHVA